MKNLSIFAVAALFATVLTSNLNAAEPLLSPRAKANQIVTVPGVTGQKLDRANLFTHRGDTAAHPRVAGVSNDRDLVGENREITVSPRALAAYPHLANAAVRPVKAIAACCKTMTKAECGLACCKDTGTKCGGTCCKA